MKNGDTKLLIETHHPCDPELSVGKTTLRSRFVLSCPIKAIAESLTSQHFPHHPRTSQIGQDPVLTVLLQTGQDVTNILTYISGDPRKVDEELFRIARKLDCSTEEVIPYLPEDLKRKYRRLF